MSGLLSSQTARLLYDLADRPELRHPHLCGQGLAMGSLAPPAGAIVSINHARELGAALLLGADELERLEEQVVNFGPAPDRRQFIVHATCTRTTRNVHTGETETGTVRPTINVVARDEADARREAQRKAEEPYKHDEANELISFSFSAELVNEI